MSYEAGYYQHQRPVYTEHSASVRQQALAEQQQRQRQISAAAGFAVAKEGSIEFED